MTFFPEGEYCGLLLLSNCSFNACKASLVLVNSLFAAFFDKVFENDLSNADSIDSLSNYFNCSRSSSNAGTASSGASSMGAPANVNSPAFFSARKSKPAVVNQPWYS